MEENVTQPKEGNPMWKTKRVFSEKTKERRPVKDSGYVPIVRYRGRKIILIAAAVVLAVPVAAWAKGPIVRATTDVWGAVLRFLGF